MIIRKVTEKDLNQALKIVNKRYKNNIIFNRLDQKTNTTFNVTLKCKDSKKPGHRLGFKNIDWATGKQIGKQRRLINACWHVHGYFFEALLEINPEARIKAGTLYINRDGGNWQDRNIGSVIYPLMYSEACECEEVV
jgi:hypothetical protein